MKIRKIDLKERNQLKKITTNRGITAKKNREMINLWIKNPKLRVIEDDKLFKKIGIARNTWYLKVRAKSGDPLGEFKLVDAEVILDIYNQDVLSEVPKEMLNDVQGVSELSAEEAKRLKRITEVQPKKHGTDTPIKTVEKMNRKPLEKRDKDI